MSEQQELKPCPRPCWHCQCKGCAVVRDPTSTRAYCVICQCGASGPVVPSKYGAISAWNTRAREDALGEALKTCVRMLDQQRPDRHDLVEIRKLLEGR